MGHLAQYCETGGAVDSMYNVFIVNCLFLYRSKGERVQMTNPVVLTHMWSVAAQILPSMVGDDFVREGGVGSDVCMFINWI